MASLPKWICAKPIYASEAISVYVVSVKQLTDNYVPFVWATVPERDCQAQAVSIKVAAYG